MALRAAPHMINASVSSLIAQAGPTFSSQLRNPLRHPSLLLLPCCWISCRIRFSGDTSASFFADYAIEIPPFFLSLVFFFLSPRSEKSLSEEDSSAINRPAPFALLCAHCASTLLLSLHPFFPLPGVGQLTAHQVSSDSLRPARSNLFAPLPPPDSPGSPSCCFLAKKPSRHLQHFVENSLVYAFNRTKKFSLFSTRPWPVFSPPDALLF